MGNKLGISWVSCKAQPSLSYDMFFARWRDGKEIHITLWTFTEMNVQSSPKMMGTRVGSIPKMIEKIFVDLHLIYFNIYIYIYTSYDDDHRFYAKIMIDWILINLKGEEGFPIIPYFWIHHILVKSHISPKITKSQLNSHNPLCSIVKSTKQHNFNHS